MRCAMVCNGCQNATSHVVITSVHACCTLWISKVECAKTQQRKRVVPWHLTRAT